MSSRTLTASLSLITIVSVLYCSAMNYQLAAGDEDDEEPIFTWCFSSPNSTSPLFPTNLNSLLSNLTTQAPLNLTTYATATVGRATADGPFGFAQCMSAAVPDDCRTCLVLSAAQIVGGCPGKSQAVVLHTHCILGYSDHDFLSQVEPYIRQTTRSANDTAEPAEFNERLGELLSRLASRAAYGDYGGGGTDHPNNSSSSRCAVDRASYGGGSHRIYGMGQCTRDLSGQDCYLCLQEVAGEIPACCQNKEGSGLYSASCSIRFDKYAFSPAFRSILGQLDRVPPSSPPPSTSDKKGHTFD